MTTCAHCGRERDYNGRTKLVATVTGQQVHVDCRPHLAPPPSLRGTESVLGDLLTELGPDAGPALIRWLNQHPDVAVEVVENLKVTHHWTYSYYHTAEALNGKGPIASVEQVTPTNGQDSGWRWSVLYETRQLSGDHASGSREMGCAPSEEAALREAEAAMQRAGWRMASERLVAWDWEEDSPGWTSMDPVYGTGSQINYDDYEDWDDHDP